MSEAVCAPILVVDDEEQFLQSASFALRSSGLGPVQTCSDSQQVSSLLQANQFSLVLLDIMMPHRSGRDILDEVVAKYPELPVIMVTAVNEVESAVDCMRAGATDYMLKPVDKVRLITSVRNALDRSNLRKENGRLKDSLLKKAPSDPGLFSGIITRNDAMLSLFRYIEAVGPSSLPVLITGETGSGKELIAKAVHGASGRSGEFVAVNVGGLDDNLFADTLFGHERGAFTGADRPRQGLIKRAAGGTLFLDEIGELRPESQIKLLRVLEDCTYYAVGSDLPQVSTARIVVATNAAIDPRQAGATLRRDLYYRLQSHHIELPPLRKRPEDIELLLSHFLGMAAHDLGKDEPTVPRELPVLLRSYHFPGNIRELRAMVFDAVSRHRGGVLSTEPFRQRIGSPAADQSAETGPVEGGVAFGDKLPTLREIEELLVQEALRRAQNNQSIAAGALGITRSALNKRLNHPRGPAD